MIIYPSQRDRQQLAISVHPLLSTRGVPGTHNINLLLQVLHDRVPGKKTCVPKFDKTSDDAFHESEWAKIQDNYDLLSLEGWCVGSSPQTYEQLRVPINELEHQHDPHGVWRRYVNNCLASQYTKLFTQLGYQLFFQVPGMASVRQ